ncbi:hypothetical protein A9404_07925 [Halothiobacillus diazotrophicus]|uniref:Diguanylate cyclase n=1 Tax=Halothiobacillus diazotrophicus TaxID=1860122 RepID=A0A191ZHF2_9GAMM|nr:EAL domain-containing protein [Halothiobacillus diazotrophicus]ANJ67321.1 hypothetical protein A9404_07925 [Halothiobacillus diazotrophicus]
MMKSFDPEQFSAIGDTLPDALLILQPNGVIEALNRAARKLFPRAQIGAHLENSVQEDSDAVGRLLKTWRRAATPTPGTLHARAEQPGMQNPPLRCEGCAVAQNGVLVLHCRPREQATKPFAILNEEIKKLQHANHELRHDREYLAQRVEERTRTIRESERRLHGILEALAEAVICFSHEGTVLSSNPAADTLFGYPTNAMIGVQMQTLLPGAWPEGSSSQPLPKRNMELNAQHRSGMTFPVEIKIRELILQDETVFTALISDISERKAHLLHLKYQAEHDVLTGLYNRRYFQSALDRLVDEGGTLNDAALLFIDLDNFKFVNDQYGHSAGDRVLKEISDLLQRHTRNSDLLARLGGDEFALLISDARAAEVDAIAERIRTSLETYTFTCSEGYADIGCSIGIADLHEPLAVNLVLGRAEFACRRAKNRGRNAIWRYTDTDEEAAKAGTQEMGWLNRIRRALRDDLFVLHIQPILGTDTNDLAASEVLIRLADQGDSLVMPNAFLPAAERFGLMPEIDRWVVRHALRRISHETGALSINLSGTTLEHGGIADYVAQQCQEHDVATERLVFEVTETAAIANLAGTAMELGKLQALGCRTALDDFGAGMSSFAYLRELPVDWVKIDGRFVRDLAQNSVDLAMVKAMHEIAHTLGKHTVAEFVENQDTLVILKKLGINFVQGYHLGRPMPLDRSTCLMT